MSKPFILRPPEKDGPRVFTVGVSCLLIKLTSKDERVKCGSTLGDVRVDTYKPLGEFFKKLRLENFFRSKKDCYFVLATLGAAANRANLLKKLHNTIV